MKLSRHETTGLKTQQTVLVVGASGFLGRCIVDRLSPQTNVICTHCAHPYFPTSHRYDFFCDDIQELLETTEVSIVIFAAMVEMSPPEEVRRAMTHFIQECHDRRLIYLSSDGIFDGEQGNYTEQDMTIPRTRYGKNLLTCETLIKEQCRDYCIIRPSYIYGFSCGELDKRLSRTRERIDADETVEIFDDMYKSPLGVEQVAEAVITFSFSKYLGTVHVAGERLSAFEFHQQAMRALGIDTANLKRGAMPIQPGFLRDTSLDSTLWQTLTGMQPLTVPETLRQSEK